MVDMLDRGIGQLGRIPPFANLFIGSGTGAAAALNGWQQRFGMWRHVPDAEQLATLLKWVG